MGRQQIRRKAGQTIQHRSSSRPKNSVHPLAHSLLIRLLLRLCQKYSLVVLIGIWLLLGVLAMLAAKTILDPNASIPFVSQPIEGSQTAAAAKPSEPPGVPLGGIQSPPQKQGEDLPFIALGTIALTCATGCLVVTRALQPRRPIKQLHSRASVQPHPALEKALSPSPSLPPATAEVVDSPDATVSATVLSAEQSHPLDWDEPSLADSLDLRQQPASSWLSKS